MLSVKNLVKVYKTKGGTEVRALDDVSVEFPETGMVFLLGRSGSGKSTLLNVAGGLDKPDSGEVIVKGKSSKDFSASDFDSYRNTFVGFVFQEYNILNEFNIEQNIALALQLQGKKNDKEAVNALLEQVDLADMGKRKPNTLSGGQKQRVAIARALIKEPEIIMADEPTGALDSNTGKQVLDTLKKLSATKLVIIVSHDREFAEQYGDRIIELKDGKILSDTSKAYAAPSTVSENVNAIGEDTVRIKDADKLTKTEFERIYEMIKGKSGEVIITSSQSDIPAVKRACKITDDGSREYFKDTAPESINAVQYDGANTKFIKSRLPIGHAIKMGASGLKTKPVRLLFTILISVISFTLFGVLLTMMMYDSLYSISEALKSTGYTTAVLEKTYDAKSYSYRVDYNGNRELEYSEDVKVTDRISEKELADMNDNDRGVKFAGVYAASGECGYSNYLGAATGTVGDGKTVEYPTSAFSGFTDCGEKFMTDNGFTKLAGEYPTKANEIAVSNYVYDQFKDRGYRSGESVVKINDYSDLVGKEIKLFDSYSQNKKYTFKITGVYNVGDYLNKYNDILKGTTTDKQSKEYEAKLAECQDEITGGFYSLAFVSDKFYDEYKTRLRQDNESRLSPRNMYGVRVSMQKDEYYNSQIYEYESASYFSEETVKDNAGEFTIYSVDGTKINPAQFTLGENEAYAKLDYLTSNANRLRNGSKQYELFYDKDGNVSYDKRGGWTKVNSFWTNYEGDVSFVEKPGYAFVESGNDVYIHKNGQSASWNEIDDMYDYKQCYVDGDGNLNSVRPADEKILLKQVGYYYTDGDGNYSLNNNDGWNYQYGEYYESNEGDGTVYIELPDGYFAATDYYYYVNKSDSDEIVIDTHENWRQASRYYYLPDGKLTSVIPEGYFVQNNFFYNAETGELSLKNEGDNWQWANGFYIDSEGNATVTYPEGESNVTSVNGIFINAEGKLSITKKAGYSFCTQWLYNNAEDKVMFARQYDGYYVNDATGEKDCDPAKEYSDSGNVAYLNYGEFNKEFTEAVKRLNAATNSGGEEASGELTAKDVALIIDCLKKDWTEWTEEEEGGLPEKLFARNRNNQEKELTIKGFYSLSGENYYEASIISSAFASSFMVVPGNGYYDFVTEYETEYVAPEGLKYNYIVTKSDSLSEDVYFILEAKGNSVSYVMTGNTVYDGASQAIYMIETLSLVFLITGLVMAVLSALMLFNFISTSISVKRKEIGVLRAVGARGTDVFKIFFAEAFIIAIICFVLSAVAAGVLCFVLNGVFAGAIRLTVLNYSILEVLLILGVSVVVAVIATILPVYFAAKKPPVESIRAL